MLKLILQTSLRWRSSCRRLASYNYSRTNQLNLSRMSSRRLISSSNQTHLGNGAAMYVAGTGILVASAAFAYYAIDTQYIPPKETEKVIDEKDIQEVSNEDAKEKTDQVVLHDKLDEAVTKEDNGTTVTTQTTNKVVPLGDITGIPYIIIGAGTAAHAACRAIRKNDPNAKILLIGEEAFLPYMRPPLSKELWFTEGDVSDTLKFKSWDGKERTVFFEDDSYYMNHKDLVDSNSGGVAVLSGIKAVSVDTDEHKVTLATGDVVTYEKLLIATGGKPRSHPAFDMNNKDISQHTTLFRDVKDFRELDKKVKEAKSVVVVGGGFLGSELACALAARGEKSDVEVMQIYAEEGNMAKVLPTYLSDWTTRKVQKEGVTIMNNQSVRSAVYEHGKIKLSLDNDKQIEADHVIVCVGIEPNVELASSGGLEVDPHQGGFRVNSELETRSDIWVAGDAACFYDINLGRRRVEHHDHAVVSGRLAGENMTGMKKAYKHQSMFWSDLGPEVGYEAIGIVDSTLPTVGVWAKATPMDTPKAAAEATGQNIRSEMTEEETDIQTSPSVETPEVVQSEAVPQQHEKEEFGKGVVFYMRDKKVVGIVLWNIFGQMPLARRIISDAKDHDDLNATASLFKLHT